MGSIVLYIEGYCYIVRCYVGVVVGGMGLGVIMVCLMGFGGLRLDKVEWVGWWVEVGVVMDELWCMGERGEGWEIFGVVLGGWWSYELECDGWEVGVVIFGWVWEVGCCWGGYGVIEEGMRVLWKGLRDDFNRLLI